MRPIRIAAQLHPQHGSWAGLRAAAVALGRAGLRPPLHMGSLLPALRAARRRALRVLEPARGVGGRDAPDRARAARVVHRLPEPAAPRRHGPDRRSHQRRPRDPRPGRRLVPARLRRVRLRLRHRRRPAHGLGRALPGIRRRLEAPQPAAGPADADPDRRGGGAADAAPRGPLRRRLARRVPGAARGARAGDRRAPALVRGDRARPGGHRVGPGRRARGPGPLPARRRGALRRAGVHAVHARLRRPGLDRGPGPRLAGLARRAERDARRRPDRRP